MYFVVLKALVSKNIFLIPYSESYCMYCNYLAMARDGANYQWCENDSSSRMWEQLREDGMDDVYWRKDEQGMDTDMMVYEYR